MARVSTYTQTPVYMIQENIFKKYKHVFIMMLIKKV